MGIQSLSSFASASWSATVRRSSTASASWSATVRRLSSLIPERTCRRLSSRTFIQLHAFRGLRTLHGVEICNCPEAERERLKALTNETPLLWMGHVGLSADNGTSIYSFQPVKPDNWSTQDLMAHLSANKPLPGRVSDDTTVFAMAEEKARNEGWNTHVVIDYMFVSQHVLTSIQQRLEELSKDPTGASHGFKYCFPTSTPDPHSGRFFPDELTGNCATFPQLFFGISIPDKSGLLREYVPIIHADYHRKRRFSRLRKAVLGARLRARLVFASERSSQPAPAAEGRDVTERTRSR